MTKVKESMVIDLTPTWGEFGNIYIRLAETGERKACGHLKKDAQNAFAAAAAYSTIAKLFTPEQLILAAQVVNEELVKMGAIKGPQLLEH